MTVTVDGQQDTLDDFETLIDHLDFSYEIIEDLIRRSGAYLTIPDVKKLVKASEVLRETYGPMNDIRKRLELKAGDE